MLSRRIRRASVLLAAASLFGCSQHRRAETSSPPPATLTFDVEPSERSQAAAFSTFAAYLAKKSGIKQSVALTPARYQEIVDGFRTGRIDCAYLNPTAYILVSDALSGTPQEPVSLAMPFYDHAELFENALIVREDSGIKSVKQLRGRRFDFADPDSTKGYVYPASMLKDAGIDPSTGVRSVDLPGENRIAAVFKGDADAAGCDMEEMEMVYPAEKDYRQIAVIGRSAPTPNGVFVARGDLDPETITALKQAMVDSSFDASGQLALKDLNFDRIVPGDVKNFDSFRAKVHELGLTVASIDAARPQAAQN